MTGKVSNGTHSGDLRYFLLPVPSDGSVVGGSPDGDPLTKQAVADQYSNSSEALKALQNLGFKDGATRRYQTGDAMYHVYVRLLHFGSTDGAKAWALGDDPQPDGKAKTFSVPGYPDVKAYEIPLDPAMGESRLTAVGSRGDVFFEIDLFGQPPVDHAVLIDRVRKQITRLDTGS